MNTVKKSGFSLNLIKQTLTGFREGTVIIIIIAVGAILSFLTPHFLTTDNLRTTAIGLSADGIVAIGMTIALVSGGFDLSVGSILGLTSVSTASMFSLGINIWPAMLLGLLVALVVGLINGLLIGKIGINPFITTLATMSIARGAAYVITRGSPISIKDCPDCFRFLGRGDFIGLPFIVMVFVIFAIFGDVMMRRSAPIRKVFYTGSNEKAAILSGINTTRVKIGVFLLTALLAGIAGILSVARFGVATPTQGTSTEMRVISAAVIGGASLSGGEGSILGTVLGVILLNVINNALVLLNISVYWQSLISGVILITAVTIDHVTHQRKLNKVITAEEAE